MVQAERLRWYTTATNDVPSDGETMGETVCAGEATHEGLPPRMKRGPTRPSREGWFHSGDLGVRKATPADVRLTDRAKDVPVIAVEDISTSRSSWPWSSTMAVGRSGGDRGARREVGERPKAFVVLAHGQDASEESIIDHVRSRIAHYKAPREVAFMDALPTNSTGKVVKFELRASEAAKRDSAGRTAAAAAG